MKRYLLIAIFLMLGGCGTMPASQPIPEKHVQASQEKALAAQHWGAIAADVAARTKRSLEARDFLYGRALYVAPSTKVPFEQAFSNFMITALVEAGLPVSTQQEGAVEIKYQTQLIPHKVEFDPRNSGYVPGAPENVGANFWIMRNVQTQEQPKPLTREEESSSRHMRPTGVEMVVTTSIVDMEQYLQRTTDAYYIERADTELFKDKDIERPNKEWKVVPQ